MANFPSSSLEPGMSGSQVKQLQQYLICKKCGKKYRVPKYRINKSKTCCKKCHNSLAGKIGGKKGKGISRNKRVKRPDLSLWNKIHRNLGEKAPNWKGGITPLVMKVRRCFEYRQWVSDIFTRDNFTCQECGVRGGYLEAHHLKRFSEIWKENNIKTFDQALQCEELWNINNGITLCRKCHNKTKQNKI